MAQIDPQLATVYSIAGMTKISFVSGHVSGALMAHFATITNWCESLPTSTSYRTGAVSPDLAVILSLCGFTVANELVLLEIDPHETNPSEGGGNCAPSDPDWSVTSRRSRAAARVDTAAFPPGWSLTSDEILLAARSTGTAVLLLCVTVSGTSAMRWLGHPRMSPTYSASPCIQADKGWGLVLRSQRSLCDGPKGRVL